MQHRILENNDDSATSFAECQSENHHTKRNKPSMQYFEDNSSESLPGIYGSDDPDKDKTFKYLLQKMKLAKIVGKVKIVMIF